MDESSPRANQTNLRANKSVYILITSVINPRTSTTTLKITFPSAHVTIRNLRPYGIVMFRPSVFHNSNPILARGIEATQNQQSDKY